jgi:hypothetical protein
MPRKIILNIDYYKLGWNIIRKTYSICLKEILRNLNILKYINYENAVPEQQSNKMRCEQP